MLTVCWLLTACSLRRAFALAAAGRLGRAHRPLRRGTGPQLLAGVWLIMRKARLRLWWLGWPGSAAWLLVAARLRWLFCARRRLWLPSARALPYRAFPLSCCLLC